MLQILYKYIKFVIFLDNNIKCLIIIFKGHIIVYIIYTNINIYIIIFLNQNI